MLWTTVSGRGRSQGVGRNHGVGSIEYENVDGGGGVVGSNFVWQQICSFLFWASGDYWGDIAEYRHVYSAIEGIQCTIYIRFYMVLVTSKFEYIW